MTKAKKIPITQQESKEVWNYNPDTGIFYWLKPLGKKIKVGDIAGFLTPSGYYRVGYDKQEYRLHRLAWLYMYGSIPQDKFVDHIDRDKSNNKISNLRLCNHSENFRNVDIRATNTSGCKGISWNKKANKWEVVVTVNHKRFYLGLYTNKEDAIIVYRDFCTTHHGEFFRDTSNNDVHSVEDNSAVGM